MRIIRKVNRSSLHARLLTSLSPKCVYARPAERTSSQLDFQPPETGPDVFRTMNRAALQKQLGRKIRAMRQGRGLSAEAFAEMCRITPIKLWDIEHGHVNPALSTLVRISRQLNVTLAGLLRRIH